MDKYRKVEKEKEPIRSNEIRVMTLGNIYRYVEYAKTLLQSEEKRQLIIKATGNAISKAVSVAEIIKRTFVGLHQTTVCGSTTLKDMYEPTEEGLSPVTEERVVSFLEITLSLDPMDENHPGYQAPLDPSVVQEFDLNKTRINDGGYRGRVPRGRGYRGYRGGRGRGGRGGYNGTETTEGEEYTGEAGEASESRGRGRGRGGRGRGRGFRGRRVAFRGGRSE